MTTEEFTREIERVRNAISQHMVDRRAGARGPGTSEELDFIYEQLGQLIEQVSWGQVPPVEDRWLSSADIVTDGWDLSDPLGEAIARLNYLYRHELVG